MIINLFKKPTVSDRLIDAIGSINDIVENLTGICGDAEQELFNINSEIIELEKTHDDVEKVRAKAEKVRENFRQLLGDSE